MEVGEIIILSVTESAYVVSVTGSIVAAITTTMTRTGTGRGTGTMSIETGIETEMSVAEIVIVTMTMTATVEGSTDETPEAAAVRS